MPLKIEEERPFTEKQSVCAVFLYVLFYRLNQRLDLVAVLMFSFYWLNISVFVFMQKKRVSDKDLANK